MSVLSYQNILEATSAEQAFVREMRNHEDVRHFMYNEEIISEAEHQAWLTKLAQDPSQRYFITKQDDTILGVFSFQHIDQEKRCADWAVYINSFDKLLGVGVKLEYLAIEYAFYTLLTKQLNCEVFHMNERVVKLHQKFGFEILNTTPSDYVRFGKPCDIISMSLSKAQWDTKREALKLVLSRLGIEGGGGVTLTRLKDALKERLNALVWVIHPLAAVQAC